ncbi:MAG: SCP2 sterol-binding domain-containing protein, partial [Myxococcota bacterium]
AMLKGEKDATKMYFGGELKVSGDVMASQRLDFLSKVDFSKVQAGEAPAPAPAAAPVAAREPVAPGFFEALKVPAGGDKTLMVRVSDPESAWTVDLGAGAVAPGASEDADTVLTLTDETLARLVSGEANEAELYMRGELRVDGDLSVARDLTWMKGA